ncbi:MAG: tRNA (adenosine(37)-N6)-dimethylallyltransferase MiaA [Thermodesulfobacteriota bacterium]
MGRIKVISIVGPTATGKSFVAMEIARRLGGEIISADSMQVYRYMDIGTAKPSLKDRAEIPHHLIDVAFPDEDYNAARFAQDALKAAELIEAGGERIILAGGTGLYIRAFLGGIFEGPGKDSLLRERLTNEASVRGRGYLFERLSEVDPVSAGRIHPNNIQRIMRALEVYYSTGRPISEFQSEHGFVETSFETLKIGVNKPRDALYRAIEQRVDAMIEAGLLEETSKLLSMGYGRGLKSMQSLGYSEMTAAIEGTLTLDDAISELKKNTRNYAKRQITWFKKDKDIRWFSPEDLSIIIETAKEFFES